METIKGPGYEIVIHDFLEKQLLSLKAQALFQWHNVWNRIAQIISSPRGHHWHPHQLTGSDDPAVAGMWAADAIQGTVGRGAYRLLYEIHAEVSSNNPTTKITFRGIYDYHDGKYVLY